MISGRRCLAAAGLLSIMMVSAGCRVGCWEEGFVCEFFRGERRTMYERMAHYSVEDQWKLYQYGVRGFHPPFLLLGPIANRGDVAARFAVGKMQQARDGLDYWMVLIVFREMIRKRNVDVCGRPEYFDVLVQGEARVPDPGWRKIYQGVLQHMCPASALAAPGTP